MKKNSPVPQLAQLVDRPPRGEEWLHEIKFDGYRTFSRIGDGREPRFYSRSGHDWTKKYAVIGAELRKIAVSDALLDGEVVVLDEKGRTSFSLLVEALKTGKRGALRYVVFDLLELDGKDLRGLPFEERKKKLGLLLKRDVSPRILLSAHIEGDATELWKSACRMGLEGMISKKRDAPYVPGRSPAWVKTKCVHGQEFVILGHTRPRGTRVGLGALILGVFEPDGTLREVGRVGTGFTAQTTRELMKRLRPLVLRTEGEITWVKPVLSAEVHFRGWTRDKKLRQASFRGLRDDKKAGEIRIDRPIDLKTVKLSSPEKVLIPSAKITKRGYLQYLQRAWPRMHPHLRGRLLSLYRCPDGIGANCFFQKSLNDSAAPGLRDAAVEKAVMIEGAEAWRAVAQMSALEIHLWGSLADDPEHPDRIVFDLDPDDSLPWKRVAKSALVLRALLKKLDLECFLLATGGKGYHVHVPIESDYDWDEVRRFCEAVAQSLQNQEPDLYVRVMTRSKRKGKIFIDIFRNGRGATAIAPYSLRARPSGTVAFPVAWNEAMRTPPDHFTLRRALTRLASRSKDPWARYFKTHQRIRILDRARQSSRGSDLAPSPL